MELLLLAADHLLNELALLQNLGIVDAHDLADDARQAVQERPIHAKRLAVADCAAKQAANDIASSFVGRNHAVAGSEYDRTNMVGNNFERDVMVSIFAIFHSCNVACLGQ